MNTQKNAPGAVQGVEGDNQKPEQDSVETMIADQTHHLHGYAVLIGDDLPEDVHYIEDLTSQILLRVHYRIALVPWRRQLILRHLRGATDEDRLRAMTLDVEGMFHRWESRGWLSAKVNRQGRSFYYAYSGTRVEDPLIQLELEMMIDLSSGVTA